MAQEELSPVLPIASKKSTLNPCVKIRVSSWIKENVTSIQGQQKEKNSTCGCPRIYTSTFPRLFPTSRAEPQGHGTGGLQ